jgi:hypothetical protein
MRASSWWPTIPADPGPARSAAILAQVQAGNYLPIIWCPVEVVLGQLRALIGVSSDAFRIGEIGDSWRVPVTPLDAQRIADELSVNHSTPCLLPTAMLDDLAWNKAAVRVPPFKMANTDAEVAIMATTARSVEHSARIDAAIANANSHEGFLVRNVGKCWINTPGLWTRNDGASFGVNYGWHYSTHQADTKAAATNFGGEVVQRIGWKHLNTHTDYSQTLTLVSDEVQLTDHATGESGLVSLASLALDQDLCGLVSHEGPVPMRHPAVEPVAGPDGTYPPGYPVPWKKPSGGPGAVASLAPWKRILPVAIAGIAIATAIALAHARKA